ncbi:hypothetical protein [Ornithinibacillus xuwenensis]|uniref:Uncharacterized protein n=1 Tax=Ornithinibacillus xuwenensis TaxID=3144668 RepID=A0ABU9XH66_9BACI
MGYILPIQQHEYADYQKRMVTRKRTVPSVERTYRAILESNYEELRQEEELRNQQVSNVPHKSEEMETPLGYTDEIYTELTGLGQYVNERV